jgi:GTP-binding protein EngB required for normal cell division
VTGLLEGARKVFGASASSDLDERVSGLAQASAAARGRVPDPDVDRAEAVAQRAMARLRLSADHTVVALAGATGSGKSSTFNALSGLDVAAIGVRRPTTSWATACVWGAHGAAEVLEWLGIPMRHQVMRDSMLDSRGEDDELSGLVLVDLPDHDSTEVSHHLEVDRLVELADLLVWVLDPQKYADAAIHDRFLRPMSANAETMLVVLNHIDEVSPERRPSVVADARRLLDADGLTQVPLLQISAVTGEGIGELRAMIVDRVGRKATARTRIAADLSRAAADFAAASGTAAVPPFGAEERTRLVDAVGDAAGIRAIADAVQESTLVRARRATGWPATRWLWRLRRDPLAGLDLGGVDLGSLGVSAVRGRSDADEMLFARVDGRVRDLAESVAAGLTRPWTASVRRASVSRVDELDTGLRDAVAGVGLPSSLPGWCWVVRVVQWLLVLVAVAGGAWLVGQGAAGALSASVPQPPRVAGMAVPAVMLIGGVVLGVLLALLTRVLVRRSARARALRAQTRLHEAVDSVIGELVVAPIEVELDAYRTTREGILRAQG